MKFDDVVLLGSGWHDEVGIEVIRSYLESVHLIRDYSDEDHDPKYPEVYSFHCLTIA